MTENKQTIKINVILDPKKMPEHIEWSATGADDPDFLQPAKGVFLSLWDPAEKAAMRIDLWTKRMMVDEMNDFLVQTLLTLGDTYFKATADKELSDKLKQFAADFKKEADDKVKKQNEEKGFK